MKRGQMQLSFGMIFSIIIIIATIGVATYVIKEFVVTSDCVKLRLYYEDLSKEVDRVWRSPSAQLRFERELPRDIKSVCFGNVSMLDRERYGNESKSLQRFASADKNVFLYPSSVCESALASYKVEHLVAPEAFCVGVQRGKVVIRLIKEQSTNTRVIVKP